MGRDPLSQLGSPLLDQSSRTVQKHLMLLFHVSTLTPSHHAELPARQKSDWAVAAHPSTSQRDRRRDWGSHAVKS